MVCYKALVDRWVPCDILPINLCSKRYVYVLASLTCGGRRRQFGPQKLGKELRRQKTKRRLVRRSASAAYDRTANAPPRVIYAWRRYLGY